MGVSCFMAEDATSLDEEHAVGPGFKREEMIMSSAFACRSADYILQKVHVDLFTFKTFELSDIAEFIFY